MHKYFASQCHIMASKIAVVSLVDPSDHPRMLHAFEYILDLRNNRIDAELFLDGASVKIVEMLAKDPKDMIKPLYDKAVTEGMLKEACNFCAGVFNVKDKMLDSKIKLSPENEHISIGRLIKEGYQVITV